MDDATCLKNISACLNSLGLKLCDVEKDTCLQHGWCVTSIIPSNSSVCVCYPCYHGDHCEKETFSQNLWTVGVGHRLKSAGLVATFQFFILFFGIIQIINCFFCLQTYFSSRRIRLTNVGIYLIFNSIVSLLIGLEEFIAAILLQFAAQLPDRYFQIRCLIDQKFVLLSLAYMWDWSLFFVAFERMLIQCYNYGLFDSLKRSFRISMLIFIICPLTTIPGIFTLKNLPTNKLDRTTNLLLLPFSCVNYTPFGYIIHKVISSIHGYGTLFSYIILSFIVFGQLMGHRKRIVPSSTTLQNIPVILRKHKDFFILLLPPIVFGMPSIVLDEIMTCSKAFNSSALPYLILVFSCIWGLIPTSLSFFFQVYPADVYMLVFWNESPAGRFLRLLKNKTIQISRIFRTYFADTSLENNQVQT